MSRGLIWIRKLDPLAVAIVLATAAVIRVVLGYRPFPSIDDFTYIPLSWASLDPELFPRDEMLRSLVNHVRLWPPLVWLLQKSLGLAEGLFLLSLLLTVYTVHLLRRMLRTLGGSGLYLPVVIALAVTVNVRGIGRGAYDGVLGDAFHMQWLALALVLGAYIGFVRRKPIRCGVYLGTAAWVHPLVAFHGALCVLVAGSVNLRRGLIDTFKAGVVALVVSLPTSIPLVRAYVRMGGGETGERTPLIRDALLFRTPHHYDLDILPFLIAGLLCLVAVAAIPRILTRDATATRRFYGLLMGQGILLLATFFFHGPFFFREQPPGPFWLYTLDLSRTTPLLLALCAIAVAAALPRPDEPLAPGKPRGMVDRAFTFSSMLAVASLLLINLRHELWVYSLFFLALLAHGMVRRGKGVRVATFALFSFAALATMSFLSNADLEAEREPEEAALHSWAEGRTPRSALFIVPPGMEAFRWGAKRSVYVDFKLIPPTHPTLAREGRRRLEEVVNHDAKALDQARGWHGLYWWDVAYAKRNPPNRIAELLNSTGADFFVQDRLYGQLPPHLPSEVSGVTESGLIVAYENPRYRVYRLEQKP